MSGSRIPARKLARGQKRKPAEDSPLEVLFAVQVRGCRLPAPVRQLAPVKGRRWRVDFAWPEAKLIIEIEGGVWSGGRHVRPAGFIADCDKYNALALDGWRVLRVPGDQVESGQAIQLAVLALTPFMATEWQKEQEKRYQSQGATE